MLQAHRVAALILAFAAASATPAARADEPQDCAPTALAALDAWLATHPWQAPVATPPALEATACKPLPDDPSTTLVAAAWATRDDTGKNLAVALVDTRRATVRAAFKGRIDEDATMRIGRGSLHIDTARYLLAPGVRAFGVDVASAYLHSCGDASFGPARSLFIRAGRSLELVMSGLMLSSQRTVNGKGTCVREAEFEWTRTSLAVAAHASHGLADLVLTDTVTGGDNPRRRHRVLHFDGTAYRDPDLYLGVINAETTR